MKTTTATKTWEIDPMHSEIHFKVKHMMVATVTDAYDEIIVKVIPNGPVGH